MTTISVSVVVDDREPANLIRAVRSHPNVHSVDIDRLSTGDIAIRAGKIEAVTIADNNSISVGIERKTPTDYVTSAFSASGTDLYDQAARLSEVYTHGYVLVEGTLDEMEAAAVGPDPAAVRGSLASLTARHIPVIPCSDCERLVDVAIRLGRKHTEEPGIRRLPSGAVTNRHEPVTKRIYGCIEGIGPTMADRLYERFPTVASLVSASSEDITCIEGIGKEREEAIRKSLHQDE
ncbi:ERCC4 domain-containing protein [Haladaptatus pallidirubidus]|uniref:ERCC4 domain-containing protein n=1 Tax=Haladaptatus pallidirubidus TaxID=1008152 RepID=UPI0035E959A6